MFHLPRVTSHNKTHVATMALDSAFKPNQWRQRHAPNMSYSNEKSNGSSSDFRKNYGYRINQQDDISSRTYPTTSPDIIKLSMSAAQLHHDGETINFTFEQGALAHDKKPFQRLPGTAFLAAFRQPAFLNPRKRIFQLNASRDSRLAEPEIRHARSNIWE